MLTREQNELLTRVGPGTPGGDFLRRYWQPVALAQELPVGGAPLPVRLMGEDLVFYRDEQGQPALLGLHCPHRGADLSYGRLEDGGLRCLYHGWLYDAQGRCMDQPGEPEGSDFYTKVRHTAYPCVERGELILTYMGPGEPPCVPDYEFYAVPDSHRFVNKFFHECSYLQGNEGNIDPIHLSFLHRLFSDENAFRDVDAHEVKGSRATPNALYSGDVSPTLETEETDFGVRIFTIRKSGEADRYVRISNFIMPNLSAFPGQTGGDGYSVNWHVPIDDTHHWKYVIAFKRSGPLQKELIAAQEAAEMDPGYRLKRRAENRYLQNRNEQKTKSFTGMGAFFAAHDVWATEGMGPVCDRTAEHLGTSDRAIIAARHMMLKAIRDVQEGKDPPHFVRDPADNVRPEIVVTSEVVPSTENWRTYWRRDKTAELRVVVPA